MLFQNGSNKVVIELGVVQFWSEIKLVISNHTYDFRPNCTPLSSVYHYTYNNVLVISSMWYFALCLDPVPH